MFRPFPGALIGVILCVFVPATTNRARGQATLPDGFIVQAMAGGLDMPTGFAFVPDGRAVIIEFVTGRVKVYANGAVGTMGTVPHVAAGGLEDGLVGVAVDPGWPTRPYIYCYYTHDDGGGMRSDRLTRFTVFGDVDDPFSTDIFLGTQYDIIDDIPAGNMTHNGGCLRFASDGTLYVGVGDCGFPCDAQDLSSLHGKILRLDVAHLPPAGDPPPKSALIPPGNPFNGPTDIARLVFCYGLRNPFRFDIDPVYGLVIGDVGESTWEELNIAAGGENFGWPWLEGPDPFMTCPGPMPANMTPAILQVNHNIPTGYFAIAPFGGVYRNQPGGRFNFGATYEGQLLYADLRVNAPLYRAAFDGMNWTPPAPVSGQITTDIWAAVSSPAEARIGPDGGLYYVEWATGRFSRIIPTVQATWLLTISGDGQKGNAGTRAFEPLKVALFDAAGQPLADEPIVFGVAHGGGLVERTAWTDANGEAEGRYTFGAADHGDPLITAIHAGSNPARFRLTWRGMRAEVTPDGNLRVAIRHSQAYSPVTIAAQFPAPTSPFVATLYGSVYTAIYPIGPGLVVLGDGLGLASPPNAGFLTGPDGVFFGTWAIPTTGGLAATLQAYALDTAESLPEMVMIGNPVTLVFP